MPGPGRPTVVPELLEDLGLHPADLRAWLDALQARRGGLLLTSGPTGSGCHTLLYAALRELVRQGRVVASAEDPVRCEVPGVLQGQVDVELGLTFATWLRRFRRSDVEAVSVGELRDVEAVEEALHLADRGVLVVAALHTTSAAQIPARLVNMGAPPWRLAESLRLLQAQRLLRALCPACAQPAAPHARAALARAGLGEEAASADLRAPGACPACEQKGYRGRLLISETYRADPDLRAALEPEPEVRRVESWARARGFPSLRRRALELAARGRTSLEEALMIG